MRKRTRMKIFLTYQKSYTTTDARPPDLDTTTSRKSSEIAQDLLISDIKTVDMFLKARLGFFVSLPPPAFFAPIFSAPGIDSDFS